MKEQLKSKLIRLLQFIQVKRGFPPAVASKLIGKMLGIKSAPIEFGIEGKRRWLCIKDLLQLQIEATEGTDHNQGPLVVNPAFGLVPGPLVVASSSKYYL